MKIENILRVFGLFAVAGGAARVVSSFIPFSPNNSWLEALYLFIDVNLLFGLIGYYLASAEHLGRTGLTAFLIAATGIVLVTGPDVRIFEIDVYEASITIVALGIGLFSVNYILRGPGPMFAPAIWLISIVTAMFGAVAGFYDLAIMLSGIVFGFGFVFAGTSLLQRQRS